MKQYLLLVQEDQAKAIMDFFVNRVQLIEVQGMMTSSPGYSYLVSPQAESKEEDGNQTTT